MMTMMTMMMMMTLSSLRACQWRGRGKVAGRSLSLSFLLLQNNSSRASALVEEGRWTVLTCLKVFFSGLVKRLFPQHIFSRPKIRCTMDKWWKDTNIVTCSCHVENVKVISILGSGSIRDNSMSAMAMVLSSKTATKIWWSVAVVGVLHKDQQWIDEYLPNNPKLQSGRKRLWRRFFWRWWHWFWSCSALSSTWWWGARRSRPPSLSSLDMSLEIQLP